MRQLILLCAVCTLLESSELEAGFWRVSAGVVDDCALKLGTRRIVSGRYWDLPPVPQWMLSGRKTSHSPIVDPADKGWTQYYNSVDDFFYYRPPKDNSSPGQDKIHIDMVEIREQGTQLAQSAHHFCVTGRLHTEFRDTAGKEIVGIGTAIAINELIALSVAHNFLPQSFEGNKNVEKRQAHSAKFELQYFDPPTTVGIPVEKYWIHPKWQQSFDSDYNFAVILLDGVVKTNGPKLFSAAPKGLKGQCIRVMGYPARGDIEVPSKLFQGITVSLGKIINCRDRQLHYNANTYRGNSGGPVILDEGNDLIGLHTKGKFGAMRNTGIQLHPDLEEFFKERLRDLFVSTKLKSG